MKGLTGDWGSENRWRGNCKEEGRAIAKQRAFNPQPFEETCKCCIKGLGWHNVLRSVKYPCAPASAAPKITCLLGRACPFQCWQVGESNKKPGRQLKWGFWHAVVCLEVRGDCFLSGSCVNLLLRGKSQMGGHGPHPKWKPAFFRLWPDPNLCLET